MKGRVWSNDLLEKVGPTVELTTLGNKLHRPVGGATYYFFFVCLIFKVCCSILIFSNLYYNCLGVSELGPGIVEYYLLSSILTEKLMMVLFCTTRIQHSPGIMEPNRASLGLFMPDLSASYSGLNPVQMGSKSQLGFSPTEDFKAFSQAEHCPSIQSGKTQPNPCEHYPCIYLYFLMILP